uniref:Uncharacterized protein n=1 Tax=Arundo donax TaxID=35708 RepID=A0A0A9G5V5_ARUDO
MAIWTKKRRFQMSSCMKTNRKITRKSKLH